MVRRGGGSWWGEVVATVALAELVGRGVLHADAVAGRDAVLVVAVAVTLVGIALGDGAGPARAVVARSVGLGALAGALALAHAGVGARAVVGPALAVVAVTLAAGGATRVVGARAGSPARGRLAVWTALALAATAPVWLGPAVERSGAAQALVDAVVAASPLTCLASGLDYLHRPWFYAHSPFASLRFAYPHPLVLTAGWLAVGTALLERRRTA